MEFTELLVIMVTNAPTFVGLILTVLVMRQWVGQLRDLLSDSLERIDELETRLDECLEQRAEMQKGGVQ